MTNIKLQIARHVGRPPRPDPVMCPLCAGVWPVRTATAWQNCEPVFTAYCNSCKVVFCPVGHVIETFFPMAALTEHGSSTLPVCLTGRCSDARELISRDFDVLSDGQPESPVSRMVLRRWLNYYTAVPPWHWLHVTAIQAEAAARFYARQRQAR